MNLAELQRRVDRHVKLDLTSYYQAYAAAGGGDIDGFLAYLGASKALDPTLLKELHGMAEVETPSVLDPAYQGTRLAAWARTATLLGTGGPRPGAPGAAPAPPEVSGADVQFRSISRIGEGAMGAVDIARDVYLRRKV